MSLLLSAGTDLHDRTSPTRKMAKSSPPLSPGSRRPILVRRATLHLTQPRSFSTNGVGTYATSPEALHDALLLLHRTDRYLPPSRACSQRSACVARGHAMFAADGTRPVSAPAGTVWFTLHPRGPSADRDPEGLGPVSGLGRRTARTGTGSERELGGGDQFVMYLCSLQVPPFVSTGSCLYLCVFDA